MTTPDFNSGDGRTSTGDTPGQPSAQRPGMTDDVSFNRSTMGGSLSSAGQSSAEGAESTLDSAKDSMKRGVDSAQDALGQLQAKASELTSRLIDNVDVDDLTQKLEQQVREHPTRTLLLAVGAGFMLGRAAKK